MNNTFLVIVQKLAGRKRVGLLRVQLTAPDHRSAVSNACHAVMRLENASCTPLFSTALGTGEVVSCAETATHIYSVRDFSDPTSITFLGDPKVSPVSALVM